MVELPACDWRDRAGNAAARVVSTLLDAQCQVEAIFREVDPAIRCLDLNLHVRVQLREGDQLPGKKSFVEEGRAR